MIDPTCDALWTHCTHGCFTPCDHEERCEHPEPPRPRPAFERPGITIHMGNMPTALRVTYALSGVGFILLAILGFCFGDQVLGSQLDSEDAGGVALIYLGLLVGIAMTGKWLIDLSKER